MVYTPLLSTPFFGFHPVLWFNRHLVRIFAWILKPQRFPPHFPRWAKSSNSILRLRNSVRRSGPVRLRPAASFCSARSAAPEPARRRRRRPFRRFGLGVASWRFPDKTLGFGWCEGLSPMQPSLPGNSALTSPSFHPGKNRETHCRATSISR